MGPDEPTSDEDADRGPKMGSSTRLEAGVEKCPFHDGAGLCSPGRWLPHKRLADPVSMKLFAYIRNLLASSFPDLPGLACEIAGGRHREGPSPEKLQEEGRKLIMAVLKLTPMEVLKRRRLRGSHSSYTLLQSWLVA